MMSEKCVYSFEELDKGSLSIAGGKGANLAEMTRKGFPVPPGFCVSVQAYFEFLKTNNLSAEINNSLKTIMDYEDSESIENCSDQIKKLIMKTPMKKSIETEILSNYENICTTEKEKGLLVAVRSSATAEDLPTASFAGQQATFLNITGGGNVVRAVKMCWASLFESRAIYYRKKNGFDDMKVGICAVVQSMIQSMVSGVMFTANPVTGRTDQIVIEAGYGLGEAIVSGSISPDMYILDHYEPNFVEKHISKQNFGIFKSLAGENEEIQIPEEKQDQQKLSDSKIIELACLGKRIQEAYDGEPQDIEWALDRKDRLFIVQTRAITTLKSADFLSEKEVKRSVESSSNLSAILKGLPASPGAAIGTVRIVNDRKELHNVKPGDILVSKMTSPDYVPVMKKTAGIITDAGGMTCHAAIIARELGIPCIVGTIEATKILKSGMLVRIDATNGFVYPGDSGDFSTRKENFISSEPKEQQNTAVFHPITATKLLVNIADPDVAERIGRDPYLCDGVGLIRAEFIISQLGTHPGLLASTGRSSVFIDGLAENLRRIASAFSPRQVTYRANDFKSNEYRGLPGGEDFEPTSEANPMIGWRGALRYITDPTIFIMELKALKKLKEEHGLTNIQLMIPFVRTVKEFTNIIELVKSEGLNPNEVNGIKVGMMCEVPSNVFLVDEFCKAGAAFMSIGSNDLAQLILGADRDSSLVAGDFDERDPAVLKAIGIVIERCHHYQVPVSICGQMPSVYPETLEFLVGSGIDTISVNPDVLAFTRRQLATVEQRIMLRKIRLL